MAFIRFSFLWIFFLIHIVYGQNDNEVYRPENNESDADAYVQTEDENEVLRDNLEFIIKPSDKISKVGDSVTFECAARDRYGRRVPRVEWIKNGRRSLPSDPRFVVHQSGSLVIRNVQFEDRGIYACQVSSASDRMSSSASLTIHVEPTFVEQPRDIEIREGEAMEISCRARGYPKPVIEWLRGNILQPTTSRQHLERLEDGSRLGVTFARSRADSGRYWCRARNDAGTITSSAVVTVTSQEPLTITTRPRDRRVGMYEEVQFLCSARGDPPPEIDWVKNDIIRIPRLSNKYTITTNSLIIHDVGLEDEGRYTCIASNRRDSQAASALLELDRRDLIDNNYGIGDSQLNSSVVDARRHVDRVIDQSIVELTDRQRARSPEDLLARFRLPSASALELTRARETFEQAIDNILADVRMKSSYNPRANLSLESVLSTSQLRVLANLSRCFTHRRRVSCDNTCFHSKYRSYDGTCNNLQHKLWGASLTALERLLPSRYEDGISQPVGWNEERRYNGYSLPSARLVSSKILASNVVTEDDKNTLMVMQWGQFLDHDMDFTPMAASNAQFSDGRHCNETCSNQRPCFPIKVPRGDPRIHRGQCLGFTRSAALCGSGMTSIFGQIVTAREQLNQITSFIDASNVYGSTEEEAEGLRDQNNDRGLLRDGITPRNGQSFLPYDRTAPIDCQIDPTRAHIPCFLAGDHRANEQLGLLSLHTIFMRHHNQLATQLRFQNTHWSGDTVYHETRKIIGAQMQHITYSHWLPNILGPIGMEKLGKYDGYDPSVSPSILNSFSTAAFRFGHSLIPPIIYRLDNSFKPSSFGNLPLHEAFFAPYRLVEEGGVDPLLRGLIHVGVKKPEPDHVMNMELTERLFRLAHQIALDLGALNVQRGRDHGLPSYNTFREYCGLTKANRFSDLRNEIKNDKVLNKLEELYRHPDNIDLFVGGLTEDTLEEAKVGPTFMCILVEQFKRLRSGDRFWYENPGVFKPEQLAVIKQTSLAGIICTNHDGTIDRVQDDVFIKTNSTDLYKSCDQIKRLDVSLWKDCHLSGSSILGQINQFEHGFSTANENPGITTADFMFMKKQMMQMQSFEGRIEEMENNMQLLQDDVLKMKRRLRKMQKHRKQSNA